MLFSKDCQKPHLPSEICSRALLLMSFLAVACSAQITWRTVATTSCPSAELRGVVYGNGQFAAVGDSGLILTSSNGTMWMKQTSGITAELYCVVWGDHLFVAAGDSGVILTSPDGITWSRTMSGTTNRLKGALWAGNQFIIVGGNGTILTSTNGTSWTSQTSPCSCDLEGIAYGAQPGIYVAVGGYPSPLILTSPNGITWSNNTPMAASHLLNAVAWNGSVFTAIGTGGTILTSPDGITSWTSQTSGDTAMLSGIIWADNQFVIVGHEGVGIFGPILTSPTGIAWTGRTSSTTQWLYSVAYGNNLFVAVGTDGTIITSGAAPTGIANASSQMLRKGAVRIDAGQVDYSLAAASNVSMKLFTIQGRLVKVLLNREQTAGTYSQDIRHAGFNLPVGKYILAFKTNETSLERPIFIGQ